MKIEKIKIEKLKPVEETLNEIEEPITKLGDVWILGKHRLMCRR